ncbi:hypothetical protein AZE42_11089 [Rhizopogon vesiculosus]|uniref:Uncharacterized protein n=1 Tax=Rhizopogon vesiculosus TaxID=180088 RepID=A0A1J8Q6S9_9AGAM|nr:hypothetical protein AZE42_11089 [Rhizopogon vesiculosus]
MYKRASNVYDDDLLERAHDNTAMILTFAKLGCSTLNHPLYLHHWNAAQIL